MIKARTCFGLLILSFGTVAATVSCGSDEATGGDDTAIGEGGSAGGGLLPGGGAQGRAGSGGRAGTSTGGVSKLGATCETDAECDDGMTCITPDSKVWPGGGPSLGMCTMTCSADDDCAAAEEGAGCVNFGTTTVPKTYCVESCTQGEGTSASGGDKCQGRLDVACRDLAAATSPVPDAFCLPLCRADSECGDGLYCSKRSGLCSKTKNTGDPPGTPCDANATTNTCAGLCIGFPDPNDDTKFIGHCAEVCAGYLPCQYNGDAPGGLCVGALSSSFDLLDEGFCESNCNCTGDCKLPGELCRAWTADESALKTALGADGLCFPDVSASKELPCGGAGGTGGTGGGDGSAGKGGGGTGGMSGGARGSTGGSVSGAGGSTGGSSGKGGTGG